MGILDVQAADLRRIAPGLELTPNGWWSSPNVSGVSYPEEGNSLCFLVEDSSFWFEHRNRCILEALRQFPPPGTFFDIGGGNGYVSRAIQESGRDVVLVEPGLAGVRNARGRGIRQVVQATIRDAGILPASLPAAGLFDVVEHIEDHVRFMREINRLIVPGGRVYLTVPAFQWLWSGEDEPSGHFRRYSLPAARRLLKETGFEVELATYFFGFLLLPVLLRRVVPHLLGLKPGADENAVRADHDGGNAFARGILGALTRRELSKIARRRTIRAGASCLLVARKRSA